MTNGEIKKAVRQGASLLRKYDSNWFEKVDLKTLNLFSADYCILGQVFKDRGGFLWAVRNIFTSDVAPSSDLTLSSEERFLYHFTVCSCDHGFEPFDAADVPAFVEQWSKFIEYLKQQKSGNANPTN